MKRAAALALAVAAAMSACGGGEQRTVAGEPPGRPPAPPSTAPAVILVGARTEPPPGTRFGVLQDACFAGAMDACDELYATTPGGSVEEAYGWGCGGRVATAAIEPGRCHEAIGDPLAVPDAIADPRARSLATACFGGDMAACDDLFRAGADDTVDELYGATCGGRVIGARALCVDILGADLPS